MASVGILSACGSDSSKTGATTGTNPNPTPGPVVENGGTSAGTTTGTTSDANTTFAVCDVPNCHADGGEPIVSPLSPQVSATPGTGDGVQLQYVTFQDSSTDPNSAKTGTLRQYELAALDYDVCTFNFNHAQRSAGVYDYGYSPVASFNFAGVYLINGTPGTPLKSGVYDTANTTGLQVVTDPNASGVNYNVKNCSIGQFAAIASGKVIIDQVDDSNRPVSGTFQLQTSGSGTLDGTFQVGACGTTTDATRVAPNPDVNACRL
jgi:hypothetical protein